MKKNTAILLVYCKDRPGLVNRITGFIQDYRGNIHYPNQHADHEEKNFFMRIEWDLQEVTLPENELEKRAVEEIIQPPRHSGGHGPQGQGCGKSCSGQGGLPAHQPENPGTEQPDRGF